MTAIADRLYALLPSVYRVRDEQQGRPLRALLDIVAKELEGLQENLDQLYDDQFIETCQPWVVPYIGDLVGYRELHGVVSAVASPRAEVANTITYRRRKGTAAMLEQLARDVTGWPARAVEFFEQLATTQYMKHVRMHAPATADLRSTVQLLRRDGPFNALAHTAEFRRPELGAGRYNIPNIGIFLWRLQPFSLTQTPLTPDPIDSARKFRFNPLGADQPLFRLPKTETSVSHVAEPVNVPERLDVRYMARSLHDAVLDPAMPTDYGPAESVMLWRPNADPTLPPEPVPLTDIASCDLRDTAGGWAHEANIDPSKIAIDPRLGRVLLGGHLAGPLLATFHTGFSRAIGGGEYERRAEGDALEPQRVASRSELLQPHLDAIADGGRLVIDDSFAYRETPVFKVNGATSAGAPGIEVVVAARNGARPLLASNGAILLDIGVRGRLVLDGLVISGGALVLSPAADAGPREIVLRHCTLVPGIELHPDGTPASPDAPSLSVSNPFASVILDQCIAGPLRVHRDARVTLVDCVVDAGSPEAVALEGDVAGAPGAELTVRESTIVGKVHVGLMRLASNSLFLAARASGDTWRAPVWAERKQEGCVRFCFVPLEALVPRRFHCVPDEATPGIVPHFTSTRYGDPGYMQLQSATAAAIRRGAADQGEIGVMHALQQPQREANLRIRFDEYLRFGLHAGIFYVT